MCGVTPRGNKICEPEQQKGSGVPGRSGEGQSRGMDEEAENSRGLDPQARSKDSVEKERAVKSAKRNGVVNGDEG